MRETNNAPRSPARRGADLTGMTGEHLLELLPVGAFVCDAAGVILRYNRRAAEIWRRVPKPGQTHRDFSSTSRFFAVDGTPDAYSLLERVLETGVPIRDVERRVERADGSTAFLSVSIGALHDADGNITGAVGCVVDISDRLRVMAALEESQRLAREQEQRLAATYEHAAIGIAEIAPGGTAGRHTHPGIETGYILEGEADVLIDGTPPLHLKAGDSYQIPAGAVHDAKVAGDKSLKVLGIYVVDKTKPLASPAP